MVLFWLAYMNAMICAVNVALYLGVGHHWWSGSVAVLTGLIALIAAIQDVANQVVRRG